MQEPAIPDTPLIVPVIAYKGSVDRRSIEEAMFSLKRLARFDRGRGGEQRASERFSYNSRVVIIVPAVCDPYSDCPPVHVACVAWTRNLSSSGISIVVGSSLTPIGGVEDTVPCVYLKEVSLEGSNALVGLFGSHCEVKWIDSHIIRAHSLSGLGLSALELGLHFKDHFTYEWVDDDRLEELVNELRGDLNW